MEEAQHREYVVKNPATGEESGRYIQMDAAAVDAAVRVARGFFTTWAATSFEQRSRIFRKASALLAERAANYADEICAETGKTRFDALLSDIGSTCDLLSHLAKHAEKYLAPVEVPSGFLMPGRKATYGFEPKGVIGIIAPWNYPLSLAAGPTVSGLAAGNTVVLKPSSQTTRSGLILKEILVKAGLPGQAFQVVTGDGSVTGQALIEHTGLDMIAFTGSTEVGRRVQAEAAKRLTPTLMELGGKDVAIVTQHANLDRAASAIVWAGFTHCGQTCMSTEVILVERAVYEPFKRLLADLTKALKSGTRAGEIGAMTLASQVDIVKRQLEDATLKGATVLASGQTLEGPGQYMPPTLLTDTTPEMAVRREETFGPLHVVIPFDTLEEAIEIANQTEYGLSGSVFTQDLEEGRRIAQALHTGSVNINDALITYAIPSLPFGGVKQSGMGRYHGAIGLQSFTNIKSMTEYKGRMKREFYWYPVRPGSDRILAHALKVMYSRNVFRRIWGSLRALGSLVGVVLKGS